MTWDLFISHASEDKDDVARPLADRFIEQGLKVWYDEYTLTIGDSLRRSIDRGLAGCRFGLVILSPHFLQKEWTQKELDGLVAREDGSEKRILPVWHKVCRNDIVTFSPLLADRLAVSTAKGINHVVMEIMRVFQPKKGQTQVQATAPMKKQLSQTRKKNPPSKKEAARTWIMIDRFFFPAQSLKHGQDGLFVVQLALSNAEEEADLHSVLPDRYGGGGSIPFAVRNDAYLVRVKGCDKELSGDHPVWTLTLAPEESRFGGSGMESSYSEGDKSYSADDIARLRASRILLNEPPPKPQNERGFHAGSFLETFISGSSNLYPIRECVLCSAYVKYGKRSYWRDLARLQAVFLLKVSGTTEHILDLTIGPVKQGKVKVSFRGRRPSRYSNVEPTVIELSSNCTLK